MNRLRRVLDALSNVGPNLFEAEVAAALAYAVVIFNLHIDDVHRAAFLGAVVLVYTIAQAAYKIAEARSAPVAAVAPVVAASAGK